jgi:capsular polysaccharide transport system permease protein
LWRDRLTKSLSDARRHFRILWALMMRELATRYGRDNIGFLWLIGEPLIFAFGVLIMWNIIKPPYEHGIRVTPFVITGYMPILLMRHMISHGLNSVRANTALLYHRQITILHLYTARLALEFVSLSLSLFVSVGVLIAFNLMDFPHALPLVYGGWFLLAWISFGVTLILAAMAEVMEYVERFVQLFTYVLIPLSGTFYMVAWLPYQFRKPVMYIPFINCVEMIRAGFFGEFVPTYYNAAYAAAWGGALTFVGLFLLRFVRERVDVE